MHRSTSHWVLWSCTVLACGSLAHAQESMPAPHDVPIRDLPEGAIARYGSRALTHAGPVGCVAFLPDGRLVSGGADRTLRLWDVDGKVERRRMADALPFVIGPITIAPDSRYAVVSDGASAFGRFDLAEWKPVFRAQSAAEHFAHAADGSKVAAFGASTRSLYVHDAETDGRLLHQMTFEQGVARSAAFNHDGTRIAYGLQSKKGKGKYDGTIGVRRLAADADEFAIPISDHFVLSMTFSPDGARLFAGDTAGNVHVIEVASGRVLETKRVHDGVVTAMRFSPDGATLATAGNDAKLALVDPQTCEVVASASAGTIVRSIAYSPDGKRIATGGQDAQIGLWNAETLESALLREGHQRPVSGVVEIDESTLATSCYDGSVMVWKDGKEQRRSPAMAGFVFQLAYAPKTRMLAAAGQESFVPLWSDAGQGEMRKLAGADVAALSLAFSHAGDRLAVTFADGIVRVYRVADGAEAFRVAHDARHVSAVAWSPDDAELWTGDSILHAWNATDGSALRVVSSPRAPIQAIDMTADGKLIAVAAADGHVHVYDRATGQEVRAIKSTDGRAKDVAFSHDGALLASSGESDAVVKLWNVADGTLVKAYEGHDGAVLDVEFAADDRSLFSASTDGSILRWSVPARSP